MKQFLGTTAFITAIFLSIGFFSCQPEVQPYTPQTDSTGTLLSYIDAKNGNDTFYVSYQYDSQKRWSGSKVLVVFNSDTSRLTIRITRDAAGYITKAVYLDSSDKSAPELDTETFYHNATTGQYTYKVLTHTGQSGTYADTTSFVYNAQAKIAYTIDGFSTGPDTIPHKYGGNNLDTIGKIKNDTFYIPSGLSIRYQNAVVLKYDSKMAPTRLGNEAVLISIPFVYGIGNVTMYTHFNEGTINAQWLIGYTYNAQDQPVKALLTAVSSNRQCTFDYHYQ